MKALNYIAALLLLSSCQKEIALPEKISTKIIDEQPKEIIYREDPSELVLMRDFAPMLWDKKEYKITEYYSVKKDLWNEVEKILFCKSIVWFNKDWESIQNLVPF